MLTVGFPTLEGAAEFIESRPVAPTFHASDICDFMVSDNARYPTVPAPFPSDSNLDGVFSSDDLIQALQDATIRSGPSPSVDHAVIQKQFEFDESLQLMAYEQPSLLGQANPCAIYDLADLLDLPGVQATIRYRNGSPLPQTVVLTTIHAQGPTLRAAWYFNKSGAIETTSLDVYRDEWSSIYARVQTQYDASGRITSHRSFAFDVLGTVRKSTTTSFSYNSIVFRSSESLVFEADGQMLLRQVRFYDQQGHDIASESFTYQDGQVIFGRQVLLDNFGNPIQEIYSRVPDTGLRTYAPVSSPLTYLVELHDAYLTKMDQLGADYAQLLAMNRLPAQDNLKSILRNGGLDAREAARYRRLNEYFALAQSIATAFETSDWSSVLLDYAHLIDTTTGNWSADFQSFVLKESLTLPLPPLSAAIDPHTLDLSHATDLADAYRASIGESPTSYFAKMFSDPAAHVQAMLASMRKVKAIIRSLDYRSSDKFPVFDWISIPDQPPLNSLGMQPIVPLTSWYFFEKQIGDTYLNNEVSERVIRERVLNSMTDESVFYVMGLEIWPIDGSPREVDISLAKLKRAADLIHKYNPNLMIGFYRLMPKRDPAAAYEGAESARYRAWQATNDHIAAALSGSVDVIFPSLYVLHLGNEYHTTEERWTVYAQESIAEAQRIGRGKPVIPFLSLYYHPNGEDPVDQRPNNFKGFEPLEPELLLYQMSFLSSRTDGAVLYYDGPIREWSQLIGTGTVEAIELFDRVRKSGLTEQLADYYVELLSVYREDLIRKQNSEQRIFDMRWDQRAAELRRDSQTALSLSQQITLLEYQLRHSISLWPLVRAFAKNIG